MTHAADRLSEDLLRRLAAREAVIGVVGLGYVGLPLLLEFADAGFPGIGLDCDTNKIDALRAGKTYIKHIPATRIAASLSRNERVSVTADFSQASACDAILVCVPTPLTEHREPDLRYVTDTTRQLAAVLRRGQLICLESTTYPGTTEEVMISLLEAGSGLKAGKDFFVAYSPEREDPCNRRFSTATIPKVVGGCNEASLRVARALYDTVICGTVPVSSCRTAEATKLMENIFRCVNIALVNELKVVFQRMGIDVWEVIGAARTKPFGYMPFYPGPGLGGHCIPIDPFYLTWKARQYGVTTRFIELAGEINTSMPDYVVQQVMTALNAQRKALNGSRLLLVGLAYKSNVDDTRESPTFALWEKLAAGGAQIDYFDPLCPIVPATREHGQLAGVCSVEAAAIPGNSYDAAVICTAHDDVDHEAIAAAVPVVVDTRHACADGVSIHRA